MFSNRNNNSSRSQVKTAVHQFLVVPFKTLLSSVINSNPLRAMEGVVHLYYSSNSNIRNNNNNNNVNSLLPLAQLRPT
jgi:hypothetical protein